MPRKTAIIGVGNKLMGDEGVGVHAVEYLRRVPPISVGRLTGGVYSHSPRKASDTYRGDVDVDVDLLDAGTGGMALFHLFEKYERVILIDAADFGGRPGEVRTFTINPPSPPFTKGGNSLTPDSTQVSLHGTSLAGILQLAEKLGTKMPDITIIAVQPEYIGCKLELSPAVKRSLTNIRKAIGDWGQT